MRAPAGWRCFASLSVLDQLSVYFERAAALTPEHRNTLPPPVPLVGDVGDADHLVQEWLELLGGSLETARLLGQRTGELHLALSSGNLDPLFTPEPFTKLYLRSVYQSLRNRVGKVCQRLIREREKLPPSAHPLADTVVGLRDSILVMADDATLLAHKSQAQKVKELVRKLAETKEHKRLV